MRNINGYKNRYIRMVKCPICGREYETLLLIKLKSMCDKCYEKYLWKKNHKKKK